MKNCIPEVFLFGHKSPSLFGWNAAGAKMSAIYDYNLRVYDSPLAGGQQRREVEEQLFGFDCDFLLFPGWSYKITVQFECFRSYAHYDKADNIIEVDNSSVGTDTFSADLVFNDADFVFDEENGVPNCRKSFNVLSGGLVAGIFSPDWFIAKYSRDSFGLSITCKNFSIAENL